MKKEKQYNGTGKSALRGRNWNLMLVDDHGRIIPFKRFKGLALTVICFLILSLLALAASGYLIMRQSSRIDRLSSELTVLQDQADSLRDEKDVLIAQLVTSGTLKITETKPPEKAENNLSATLQSDQQASPAVPTDQQPALSKPDGKPEGPATPMRASEAPTSQNLQAPKPVKTKWGAQIHQFKASYESNRSAIKAAFQLHNTSSPKEKLSGHVVVVLKNSKKTPPQWIAMPQVELVDGVPDGKAGKRFRINNYMTIQTRAYDQRPPVVVDSATVYIFSEGAQLIHSEDFDLDINIEPIAKSGESEPAANESDRQPAQPQSGHNLPSKKIEGHNAVEYKKNEQGQDIAPADQQFLPSRNSDLPEASEKPFETDSAQKSLEEHQDANQSESATTIIQGEPQ